MNSENVEEIGELMKKRQARQNLKYIIFKLQKFNRKFIKSILKYILKKGYESWFSVAGMIIEEQLLTP